MHFNKLYEELEWSFYQIHKIHYRQCSIGKLVKVGHMSHMSF